ncbi:ecotropic viral integration site 5 ortholog-like isoform X2 [Gordionus sp. m RMFG-2023]|uniref:ecotropic viral integration site 5 ortholog-like isoform X2 n=1 Tax=Gordionus sp. m RMFG-2023 TaxID=3053472 RepID=UPI0031FDD8E3
MLEISHDEVDPKSFTANFNGQPAYTAKPAIINATTRSGRHGGIGDDDEKNLSILVVNGFENRNFFNGSDNSDSDTALNEAGKICMLKNGKAHSEESGENDLEENGEKIGVARMGDGEEQSKLDPVYQGLMLMEDDSIFVDQDLVLLAKLEEANRVLENDSRSLLGGGNGPSSQSSTSSQCSLHSGLAHQMPTFQSATTQSAPNSSCNTLKNPANPVLHANTSSSRLAFIFSSFPLSTAKTTPLDVCPDHNEPPEPEATWAAWSDLLMDWETRSPKNASRIKELVLRGIPQPFRAMAWQLLSGSVPPTFLSPTSLTPIYSELLKKHSLYEKLIRRDITRTYPEHSFFKEPGSAGQESLFNVMKAYSLHDPEVGYCQGSCFIVGLLLMQMPEEEAFSVLTKIMHKYNLRKLFKPSMSELALCMYQLECLIQEFTPDLFKHFQDNNFHASLYASPWFLTLFSSSLPLETAFRIMDVFLLEYFQRDIPSRLGKDPDLLFHVAFGLVPFNERKMKRMEKEFTGIKVKQQEELGQIRKLKQENRLLKQRIQYLEQESASLADKLIQGQVSRAVQAEENFSLKQDFNELRKVLDDKDESLRMALNQISWIKELENGNEEPSRVDQKKYEEVVNTLQQELLAVKYREAECLSGLDDYNKKYDRLEHEYRTLKMSNDSFRQGGQQELDFLKLKEIESHVKSLRQKIQEFATQWEQYVAWTTSLNQTPPSALPLHSSPPLLPPSDLLTSSLLHNSSIAEPPLTHNGVYTSLDLTVLHTDLCRKDKKVLKQLIDYLVNLKLNETNFLSESGDLKAQLVELQSQINAQTKSVESANKNFQYYRDKFEEYYNRDTDTQKKMKSLQYDLSESQSQLQEKSWSLKLRETELMERLAEAEESASRLATQKQENILNASLVEVPCENPNGSVTNSEHEEREEEVGSDDPGSNHPIDTISLAKTTGGGIEFTDTDSSSLISLEESMQKIKHS